MADFVIVDRAVALMLSFVGGAAGAFVLSTVWGGYIQWRQTRELERQTAFQEITAEATVRVLEELRGGSK